MCTDERNALNKATHPLLYWKYQAFIMHRNEEALNGPKFFRGGLVSSPGGKIEIFKTSDFTGEHLNSRRFDEADAWSNENQKKTFVPKIS